MCVCIVCVCQWLFLVCTCMYLRTNIHIRTLTLQNRTRVSSLFLSPRFPLLCSFIQDPNYLSEAQFQQSPWHIFLHIWKTHCNGLPLFHIDIHGCHDRDVKKYGQCHSCRPARAHTHTYTYTHIHTSAYIHTQTSVRVVCVFFDERRCG